MVTVPAFVWAGGSLRRALTVGAPAGAFLGILAWLDSGFVLAGLMVLVIVGSFAGVWISRRMARYWPGSKELNGVDRVTVVRAARNGQTIADTRLAQPVVDYSRGLRAAAEQARPLRWLLAVVLVVAAATAVWDSVFGSWGNAVASGIYLVLLMVELFWWPKRQAQLLANADRAADTATRKQMAGD
ncbi:hypothetical protein [Mycobacterium sp. URHB0021]|jgi:hypothetical protein